MTHLWHKDRVLGDKKWFAVINSVCTLWSEFKGQVFMWIFEGFCISKLIKYNVQEEMQWR